MMTPRLGRYRTYRLGRRVPHPAPISLGFVLSLVFIVLGCLGMLVFRALYGHPEMHTEVVQPPLGR